MPEWFVASERTQSEIAFKDMLDLDIHYVEHWSLWLDLRIIWQTILVVVNKGAYYLSYQGIP